jgi:hypothetical protein
VFCQPNVQGLFLFHTVDEKALSAWQSGVYYADDTPKASLKSVQTTLDQSRRGVVTHCDGLELTVKPKIAQVNNVITVTCDLDCAYVAQLYRLPGKLLTTRKGTAIGGRATRLSFAIPKTKGTYRVRLTATAPMNPGPATLVLRNVRPG